MLSAGDVLFPPDEGEAPGGDPDLDCILLPPEVEPARRPRGRVGRPPREPPTQGSFGVWLWRDSPRPPDAPGRLDAPARLDFPGPPNTRRVEGLGVMRWSLRPGPVDVAVQGQAVRKAPVSSRRGPPWGSLEYEVDEVFLLQELVSAPHHG